MTINQHGAGGEITRVVDQFDAVDLGAPFKVVLHKAVRVTLKYSIPDTDGLISQIAISRVLNKRKLSGKEIHFIRKAIKAKQKELAQRIEMSAEHLSRCESGAMVMSPTSEKLLRIYALKTAWKLQKLELCEETRKLEQMLDRLFDMMKPVSVFDPDDVLELHFNRVPKTPSNGEDLPPNIDGDGHWNADELKSAA